MKEKINYWIISDWIMVAISLMLFIGSFPLHQWDWGWTSDKLEVTLITMIGYMALRANFKK